MQTSQILNLVRAGYSLSLSVRNSLPLLELEIGLAMMG